MSSRALRHVMLGSKREKGTPPRGLVPSMGGVHFLGGGAAGIILEQDLAWPSLADLFA